MGEDLIGVGAGCGVRYKGRAARREGKGRGARGEGPGARGQGRRVRGDEWEVRDKGRSKTLGLVGPSPASYPWRQGSTKLAKRLCRSQMGKR